MTRLERVARRQHILMYEEAASTALLIAGLLGVLAALL
jgi:hypothetical protein